MLLPFKPGLSEQDIHEVRQSLHDLRQHIPEIRSFTWINNNSSEGLHRGYLHGFTMDFDNDRDRQLYLDHPEHVKVAKEIVLPALSDGFNSVIVFDHEY